MNSILAKLQLLVTDSLDEDGPVHLHSVHHRGPAQCRCVEESNLVGQVVQVFLSALGTASTAIPAGISL
jgi:hypothetical protein